METLILKTNQQSVESEISHLERDLSKFQPFATELLKNQFDGLNKPLIAVIRDLVTNGTLHSFLKEQAVKKTPEVQALPIKMEMKLEMVDLEAIFPNLKSIELHYNSIRKLAPQIRKKIYSYDLGESNTLYVSEYAMQAIIESNTISAKSEKQKEAYIQSIKVLSEIKALKEKYGFNIFRNGSIEIHGIDANSWQINPHAILNQVEP